MYYVYKITNKVNGKVYIGKSGQIKKRWKNHLAIAKRGNKDPLFSVIHAAIRKYGTDNFLFEIVDEFNSEQESIDREVYWISYYKSNVSKYGSKYGYNLTDGGEGLSGFSPSKETRKKLSEACAGEKNGFYGKTHTDKTKNLISKKRKEYSSTHPANFLGKKHSDETKDKMRQKRAENFHHFSAINTGSKNPNSKLTEEDVVMIKKLLMENKNDNEIAEMFSVQPDLIGRIRVGKAWSHIDVVGFIPFHNERRRAIKLTEEKVVEIKKLINTGMSAAKIAKLFSVSNVMICNIRRGDNWAHVKIES